MTTTTYYLTSPKSVNREIELVENMQDEEISEFERKTFRGQDQIVLKGGGTVYCTLTKGPNGVYRGRDIRGGFTSLTPKAPAAQVRTLPKVREQETKPASMDRRYLPVDQYRAEVDAAVDNYTPSKEGAIAVIGCNRPNYMRQVIEGLRANKDLSNYDVYLFLDKPKDRRDYGAIKDQIEMGLTNRVIQYPVNFGCGRAIIDVRRQIFDRLGYEKAFIFEDDLVPNKNYLTFCERLLKWGQENYTNVGAVQGWSKCLLPPEEKKALQQQVHITYTNWWGYLTTKEAWDKVKSYIYSYGQTYLKGDYSVRPTAAILQYFKPASQRNFQLAQGGAMPDDTALRHRRSLFDSIPSGQDGATWLAYDRANLVRLAPTVNRAIYIGEEGIHSTREFYRKQRFDRVTLEDYPTDARRRVFKLR